MIHLTEQLIRDQANSRSYERGLDYYLSGAIYSPTWQTTPDGIMLSANCSGSSEYSLQVELYEEGIGLTSCTCPYDLDGDCKHIIALLLMYLHKPEKFSMQKSVSELLYGLSQGALVTIIQHLVKCNPELYPELVNAIPTVKANPQTETIAKVVVVKKRQTDVSEVMYRKLIQKIFKQTRSHEYDADYDSAPPYIKNLEETLQIATKTLETGDAEGALIILRILFEETIDQYDSDIDYDGEVADFIQSLGMPFAEAILSTEFSDQERSELHDSLRKVYDQLSDEIDATELEVILCALKHGWNDLSEVEAQGEVDEADGSNDEDHDGEDFWISCDALEQARLNVLERQNRPSEFLQLAQKVDTHRYVLKLLQLGQVDDAIAASQELKDARSILDIAQKLFTAGLLDTAIHLAEQGLELQGSYVHELAIWLAPLEEARGYNEMALFAYQAAYQAQQTINLYRHIKRLSGQEWARIRPALVQIINEGQKPALLADIYLEEHEWDAAITLAKKYSYSYNLLEKVADAVVTVRTDWVINTSLKKASELINPTQSKLYPDAAEWLARAKKAYLHNGKSTEWNELISNLRATYSRRPALQRALAAL